MLRLRHLFFFFLSALYFPLGAIELPSYEEITDLNELHIQTPSLSQIKKAKMRLDNGLDVLLVSDPFATKSAAGLSMEVGYWSDPVDYPGIAHFTEHLLFLGSHTFPEENGYMKHVNKNGGMLNAFTAPDRTVYSFSVNHDAFPSTIDYFSHMFIDPLFCSSGIGRELHAVDQEHDKNIENDSFREYMVLKDQGNPRHPHSRFCTGNAETLKKIPREEVIKWYRENYSSDKAHLVIYSPLPIEELKALAVNHFSSVPLTSSSKAYFPDPLYLPSQSGSLTYITPIRDVRELSVFWELPEMFLTNIEDKSDALISYILESQHPNSLYSKLKEKDLIESIRARKSPLSRDRGFFSVDFSLTPQGVLEYEEIISALFCSLATIKNHSIPSYIFDEVKNMARIDYEFQGRESPFSYVTDAAYHLVDESLETFPQKSILPSHFDPHQCHAFLSQLTPKKAQYSLKARPELTGMTPDIKEKWSGAEYVVQQVNEKQLNAWEKVTPYDLSLYPEQNPFIPAHLELVTKEKEADQIPTPLLMVDNELGKVYFWQDERYLVPEVSWIINFKSPFIDRSPHQIALLTLFEKCLQEHLESTSYYANAASLSFNCGQKEYEFVITLGGFSEKASTLFQKILESLSECQWSKKQFDLNLSLLKTNYENFYKSTPLRQGMSLMQHVLFNIYPKIDDKISALDEITYEDFLKFKQDFLKQAYTEMMLTGNMTKEDALEAWSRMQAELNPLPYPKEKHREKSFLVLPSSEGPYKVHEKIDTLGHAALLLLQEGPFTFDSYASASVLATALADDVFQTLRTKQQSCYIVDSMNGEEDGQLFQLFYVQSSTHEPSELISRFELIIEDYVKDFETHLPEGVFENIRTNLITSLKQPPTNLSGMASTLYALAFKYDGDFKMVDKKIEALTRLNYENLKNNSQNFLARTNRKRIAFEMEGHPADGKEFHYQDITADQLKTQGAYVTWKQTH